MLAGKVALITGASSGIGASTAVLFAKLGANLSLTGRNMENLERTLQSCQLTESQKKPLLIQADLSSEEDTSKLVEKTVAEFGKLDILVNNAGVLEMGTIENTSLDQYDRVMNVNVRAIYQLTMLATPELVKTKGNIVNVSSVNGIRSVCVHICLLNRSIEFIKLYCVTEVSRCPGLQYFQGCFGSVHAMRCS